MSASDHVLNKRKTKYADNITACHTPFTSFSCAAPEAAASAGAAAAGASDGAVAPESVGEFIDISEPCSAAEGAAGGTAFASVGAAPAAAASYVSSAQFPVGCDREAISAAKQRAGAAATHTDGCGGDQTKPQGCGTVNSGSKYYEGGDRGACDDLETYAYRYPDLRGALPLCLLGPTMALRRR